MSSFIESALLKISSESSTPKDAFLSSCNFKEQLGGLVHQLKPKSLVKSTSTSTSTTPVKSADVASMLLELTEVASQLARSQLMLAQITETVPEEECAKQYHAISLQALQCSCRMLSEKQTKCLEDLRASIGCPDKPARSDSQDSASESTTWKGWGKKDIEAIPEFVPSSDISSKLIGSGSLRQDLELLRQRQPEHVIIVRKIKKLGFESPQLLDEHFSQFGEVKELLVAHSHVKATAKRPNGRVRPAALGFVVMAEKEAAHKAFKAGEEQMVCGQAIELASFESFDSHYADEDEN